jgi:hypothetical protein
VCYAAAHPPGTKRSNVTIFWCFLVIVITNKVGKRPRPLPPRAREQTEQGGSSRVLKT